MLITELCKYLQMDFRLQGKEREVYFPAPLTESNKKSYSFCDFPILRKPTRRPLDFLDHVPNEFTKEAISETKEKIYKSKASMVICSNQFSYKEIKGKTLVLVENPRIAFMNVVEAMYFGSNKSFQIHPSAVVENAILGKNVRIGANSVIGGDGFGFWRVKSGKILKFPQIGKVIIGDDVEIQASVCIDKGALSETRIGAGTKIDNLVHIAHNAQIGKNCVIVAQAFIGGSVEIGDESWIAPQSVILNSIKIGKKCIIGMGAVVIEDVPDGATVVGNPARKI